MECLNEMAKHYKIPPNWVPAHQDIAVNCIAAELAGKRTTVVILQRKNTIGMPIANCRLFIKHGTLRQAELSKMKKHIQLRDLQTDMAMSHISSD